MLPSLCHFAFLQGRCDVACTGMWGWLRLRKAAAGCGGAIAGTSPAPSSPVALLRDLGPDFLLILQGSCVVQEAVVKAVCRNKILHVLDFRWGLCSWGGICAHRAGTQAGVMCDWNSKLPTQE